MAQIAYTVNPMTGRFDAIGGGSEDDKTNTHYVGSWTEIQSILEKYHRFPVSHSHFILTDDIYAHEATSQLGFSDYVKTSEGQYGYNDASFDIDLNGHRIVVDKNASFIGVKKIFNGEIVDAKDPKTERCNYMSFYKSFGSRTEYVAYKYDLIFEDVVFVGFNQSGDSTHEYNDWNGSFSIVIGCSMKFKHCTFVGRFDGTQLFSFDYACNTEVYLTRNVFIENCRGVTGNGNVLFSCSANECALWTDKENTGLHKVEFYTDGSIGVEPYGATYNTDGRYSNVHLTTQSSDCTKLLPDIANDLSNYYLTLSYVNARDKASSEEISEDAKSNSKRKLNINNLLNYDKLSNVPFSVERQSQIADVTMLASPYLYTSTNSVAFTTKVFDYDECDYVKIEFDGGTFEIDIKKKSAVSPSGYTAWGNCHIVGPTNPAWADTGDPYCLFIGFMSSSSAQPYITWYLYCDKNVVTLRNPPSVVFGYNRGEYKTIRNDKYTIDYDWLGNQPLCLKPTNETVKEQLGYIEEYWTNNYYDEELGEDVVTGNTVAFVVEDSVEHIFSKYQTLCLTYGDTDVQEVNMSDFKEGGGVERYIGNMWLYDGEFFDDNGGDSCVTFEPHWSNSNHTYVTVTLRSTINWDDNGAKLFASFIDTETRVVSVNEDYKEYFVTKELLDRISSLEARIAELESK